MSLDVSEMEDYMVKDAEYEAGLNKTLNEIIAHSIRVSNLAYNLAKELELTEEQCYDMANAGALHDIGKIKLMQYMYQDSEINYTLKKMYYMRMHSGLGYDILCGRGYSEFVLESVLHHHENYDGSGYPDNLRGEDIPIGARILRISDVYSALTSDRVYRDALDTESAIKVMIGEIKNFDMKIFLAFQRVIHEVNIDDGKRKEELGKWLNQ